MIFLNFNNIYKRNIITMTVFSRTYNHYWSAINFNGCQDYALMSERIFAVKPRKTEVEYDVVEDLGEW